MPIGRPFQKGAPRPPNSGRRKGTRSKPRSVIQHIERNRARREAALEALYLTDPKDALRLEAQMLRDDVVLAGYEQESTEQPGTRPDSEIRKLARIEGPISAEQAMAAYLAMLNDGDEARVIMARFQLHDRHGPLEAASRLALGLATMLRDLATVRAALADGRIAGATSIGQLLSELTPPPLPAPAPRTEPGSFEDGARHQGIPTGEPGHSLIERQPPQREQHADPPPPPRIIEGEASRRPASADPRFALKPLDLDSEDRVSAFEDEDVPIFASGHSFRR